VLVCISLKKLNFCHPFSFIVVHYGLSTLSNNITQIKQQNKEVELFEWFHVGDDVCTKRTSYVKLRYTRWYLSSFLEQNIYNIFTTRDVEAIEYFLLPLPAPYKVSRLRVCFRIPAPYFIKNASASGSSKNQMLPSSLPLPASFFKVLPLPHPWLKQIDIRDSAQDSKPTVLFELIASLYCFVVFFTLLVLCTHKKE